jgi:prephenate dehydrogenase
VQWSHVSLIGVGLLGGSIGLALRQRGLAGRVTGYVRRSASVKECRDVGAVDEAMTDVTHAVAGAELIILCTPIAQMRELTERMLPAVERGALITDVGSVKAAVMQELESIVAGAGAHFIGSHPMAGAEKMGVAAARADLFESAACVITPSPASPRSLTEKLDKFWRSLGATPMQMGAELHDDLVSRSSHLPHVVAAELANYVLSPVHPKEQARLCAAGFRDTTRVASGSPEMWRDICMANRRNLSRVLGVFIEDLEEFRHALESMDPRAIEEFFVKAKQRRDAWCNPGGEASLE